MKRPDRFERAVGRYDGDRDDFQAKLIPAARVLTLLRAQHRAMVRMVREVGKIGFQDGEFQAGRDLSCDEILSRLKEYAQ